MFRPVTHCVCELWHCVTCTCGTCGRLPSLVLFNISCKQVRLARVPRESLASAVGARGNEPLRYRIYGPGENVYS